MASLHTRVNAIRPALLELLVIVLQVTGFVNLATLLARLVSIIHHTVPAASMAKDIFRLQLLLNHVFFHVLMVLSQLEEFVRFVTSVVLLVLVQLKTVFPALLVNSSTKVDAGLNVLLFLFRKLVKMLLVLTTALMPSTKYLRLNALLVLLSAQLAKDHQLIVLHVFMDLFQSMVLVLNSVVRMNIVSKVSV
jgi:hypothetical protein